MRGRFVSVWVLCMSLGVLHCSGDDSAATSQDGGGGDAAIGGEGGPTESGLTTIDVHGTLNGNATDGGALTSRDVVVIDAAGVVTKTTSGVGGAFAVANVATPYDIAVPYVPADAASPAAPFYFAGITRADPLVTGEDYGPRPVQTAHTSTVTVTLDACSGCILFFSSTGEAGSYDYADVGTGAAKAYAHTYSWFGPDTTFTAAFHFYVEAAGPGAFTGYADIAATTLQDGTPTSLGTPTIQPLTGGSTISVSAALPAGYGTAHAFIDLLHPDGARVATSSFAAATGTMNLPAMGSLAVTSAVTAQGPNASSALVSERQPVAGATDLNLTMLAAPTLLTPAEHSSGITDAQSLTWSAFGSPTTYEMLVSDPGGSSFVIYTADTSFPLDKLTKAGLPMKAATTYTWEVIASGTAASMDEYVGATLPDAGTAVVNEGESFSQTFTTQ